MTNNTLNGLIDAIAGVGMVVIDIIADSIKESNDNSNDQFLLDSGDDEE